MVIIALYFYLLKLHVSDENCPSQTICNWFKTKFIFSLIKGFVMEKLYQFFTNRLPFFNLSSTKCYYCSKFIQNMYNKTSNHVNRGLIIIKKKLIRKQKNTVKSAKKRLFLWIKCNFYIFSLFYLELFFIFYYYDCYFPVGIAEAFFYNPLIIIFNKW